MLWFDPSLCNFFTCKRWSSSCWWTVLLTTCAPGLKTTPHLIQITTLSKVCSWQPQTLAHPISVCWHPMEMQSLPPALSISCKLHPPAWINREPQMVLRPAVQHNWACFRIHSKTLNQTAENFVTFTLSSCYPVHYCNYCPVFFSVAYADQD